MNKRIFQFPTSALKLGGRKLNYYDYLIKAENADCNAAVQRIYSRLDIEKIHHFIEYSESNIRVLEERAAKIESGKSVPKEHELIEV